ncbi:trafficking protein Mon1-domain-containing protein [Lasiosphaeria miniovina]|uniref:Vacuolar fusion protein MON1 n=1 Tax=Lasiosphaeria miniovina TaxID=1954250 RepID=A0AA40EFN1_9PEZI|nr:trafficking protein Mon1-domain-containing protein [Lasiosphaeria miniovina]KAK0733473.1 trafficking protein Mon1-domain-containing protein [Lasiosphaeria miniovina]
MEMDTDTDSAPPTMQPPPPPLPPRPPRRSPSVSLGLASPGDALGSLLQLQVAPATTAVSSIDISTLSFPDGSRGTFSRAASRTTTRAASTTASGYATPTHDTLGALGALPARANLADGSDSMSLMSFAPTLRPPGDLASLVAGELNRKSPAWMLLRSQSATVQPFETSVERGPSTTSALAGFESEFDDIPDRSAVTADEDRLALWKAKLKHYMILSSAGKPIYSRHGDLGLVNSYMGIVQTIISFYEGAQNPLLGFTAGNARFVIATEGPLYLVAISRLGESDAQLRSQLDALYMQILSTLTLPTLQNIFVHRPSTDLRKPLEGTESLLSSLADSFTRGSPSALLGALECLRLRKSQRHSINNAFLKLRGDRLLYGLIVAGGKLVSVIRPRKHSLHPSDLQLIFNMLFTSGGIRAGGGENWIPLCLPAFNNRGYLYMYVSFFGDEGFPGSPGSARNKPAAPREGAEQPHPPSSPLSSQRGQPEQAEEDEIAIILISTDKESFFELKEMRDSVAHQLAKNGSLAIIKEAVRSGRPSVAAIAPGAQISHFLYKSRANVQFCMASLDQPAFGSGSTISSKTVTRRRLMSLYHELHASMHAKHSHLKVLHCVGDAAASLAWITPVFEFYCVAGPNISRALVTQGANKIIQWARREEERLFIIGGGVF